MPPLEDPDAALRWRERAAAVIPGGASTGSKRPAALFGRDDPHAPTHYVSASGCRIHTPDGRELVDCTMALGAVGIGYADELVVDAAADVAARGSVSGLSHVLEVQVAERLCDVIPCAERVRFLKSGAEGMQAAVRIARAHTGRSRVIGSGYFGWLDWWSDAAGVPPGAHEDFEPLPFDDVDALARAASRAGDALAAVVLEPIVERLPSAAWLAEARRACDRVGAVLIFDEMKTGFRVRRGGFQELAGMLPDVAVFGKALANGFPLAAVVGRADIMAAAERTWISSTLGGEAVALAAANAVLDWHEREDVCAALWRTGEAMQSAVADAIADAELRDVEMIGIAPMWLLRFADPGRESRFLERAVEAGVLFKRGAYNYAARTHDDAALDDIARAAREAMRSLAEEGSHVPGR
jgi:glutamate-1-semialdehyde aminotransferase